MKNLIDTPAKVKALRQRRAVTHDVLAADLGLAPESLKQIERGHNKMSQPLIRLLTYYDRYGALKP